MIPDGEILVIFSSFSWVTTVWSFNCMSTLYLLTGDDGIENDLK